MSTNRNSSKRWLRSTALALTAVATLALPTGAASATPAPSDTPSADAPSTGKPLPAATRAKVERIVRRFQDTNKTPGVLVGIWSPKGDFVSATGVADLVTKEPLEPDMQFKVASQTKAFTANLILQLIGEGKVSFDDHISEWVPEAPNSDQITIRQLLTMTSGLGAGFLADPANVAKLNTGCAKDENLTLGATQPPEAAPGTEWIYSNYGYDLLGRVVELETGLDISTAIQQRIAEPLGLRRTYLPPSGNGLTEPFAHGYGVGDATSTLAPAVASDDATALHQSCFGASGGMVSTLDDLRIWSRALATGELLEPAVWKEAKKGTIPFAFPDDYQGPGRWRQGAGFIESGGFIGKDGSEPGYDSLSMYSPSRKMGIVVVSTKQPNAITPPPMLQALAMAVYGPKMGFGITPARALEPSFTGYPVDEE